MQRYGRCRPPEVPDRSRHRGGRRSCGSGLNFRSQGGSGSPRGSTTHRTAWPTFSDLKVNEPLSVDYPDDDAPGVLLKFGTRVPTGVGPDGDIVGFTTICPHKGFPLAYNKNDRTLNCPGHYSRFDVEAGGQQTWGHATQNLPQYVLRVDDNGDIYAEGVDELLYGRLSNVL